MTIDHALCAGCGRCINVCPKDALVATWGQHDKILDEKTAEYTAAVLHGNIAFSIKNPTGSQSKRTEINDMPSANA